MTKHDYLDRARTARLLADAYGLAHGSTRLTPAAPQAVKLCACGRPAVQFVGSLPMCAQHALAAMGERK